MVGLAPLRGANTVVTIVAATGSGFSFSFFRFNALKSQHPRIPVLLSKKKYSVNSSLQVELQLNCRSLPLEPT
jgi:hypothetical protein